MTFDKKRNGTFMNVSVPSNKNLIHFRPDISWEGCIQCADTNKGVQLKSLPKNFRSKFHFII